MAKQKSRRVRREFTAEFKQEVVALIDQGEKTLPQICRDLDLTDSAVRRWVKQLQGENAIAASADKIESDNEELKRLRADVKRLTMERDILKKATAFFAKESQ